MSAGNSRAAYMTEYRKRRRLEDNCNNVPKRTKLHANDSLNIEKHIKTYLLNTGVFNVNPGNQGSPIIFCEKDETFQYRQNDKTKLRRQTPYVAISDKGYIIYKITLSSFNFETSPR
jgi:hypothetical protein